MNAPAASLRLSDAQRLNWLRLLRSDNVGPSTFRDLINRYGSAKAALDALPDLAARGGKRKIRIATAAEAEAELDRVRRFGGRIIAVGEADYPPMLRHMDVPPPLVTVMGRDEVFSAPAVAIVGARNASASGAKMARLLAGELGQAGFTIVSGLARGIDAAAHWASLDTGTVAVLAGGLDKPYPPENLELIGRIARQGAVITEMPFGWEPRARDFPRRNRLIAGLGLGLVVVEAAQRSGSLISARLAGDLGRQVFAVPGSPIDPRAAGSNGLLKDGAVLTLSGTDVIEQLAPMIGRAPAPTLREPDNAPPQAEDEDVGDRPPANAQDLLVEAMGPVPMPVDEIVRHAGLPARVVATLLLELDLAGRLERHSGGAVSLTAPDQ
ncbi:DNA-protecting protein DprA [Aliihoeflea aestuarii]|jgi:DNA processing protein|uniref:DNA-processing protein DprA n=1 Tax=Aliihoeflea aestuarii TaxID=453840 RepID=UPI002092E8AB|nr:DNA-processing protein DprA [Aliihoeflea aestuarii]MCO6390347.1 DNA-protecting protein DprA [Aliihoeflea aestuarii]